MSTTTTLALSIQQQDNELAKQYKFKYFRDEVISVLQLFDKPKEWADLIKCLKRLSATIKRYSAFPALPEKLTVMKRLAQCLNPSLPSGVHLKVLDTFDTIFGHVGNERLSVDIGIFFVGLFSFLPVASLQAKPIVLDLFERYFINLSVQALLPSVSGFQLAILSALEEESTEISNRARSLLDRFCNKFETSNLHDEFYGCLWKNILLTPQSRVPASSYIIYTIKRKKTEQLQLLHPPQQSSDVTSSSPSSPQQSTLSAVQSPSVDTSGMQFPTEVFANNIPLVVSGIASALGDDTSILVQRAALELLVTQVTFDSQVFPREQYVVLLRNALLLLCKKDLSINRRIFQWMFGNIAAEFHEQYFGKHVVEILVDALRGLLSIENEYSDTNGNNSISIIILVLQQSDFPVHIQSQICTSIIENVLYYLHRHFVGKSSQTIIDSFLVLFPMLEPKSMVWDSLITILKDSNIAATPDTKQNDSQYLELIDLIGGVFSVLYSEKLDVGLLVTLENELLDFLRLRIESNYPSVPIIETTLLLCINVFTKIPDHDNNTNEQQELQQTTEESTIGKYMIPIYQKVESIFSLFAEKIIMDTKTPRTPQTPVEDELISPAHFNDIFKSACTFMTLLLPIYSQYKTHSGSLKPSLKEIPEFLNHVFTCCLEHSDPHVIVFSIETFLGIVTKNGSGLNHFIQQSIIRNKQPFNHLEQIIHKLWNLLTPEYAVIHFEVVKLLVELHALNKTLCNTLLSDFMLDSNLGMKIEGHRRFALIWRLIDDLGIDQRVFDDGMFLMLDSIKSDDSNLRLVGRSWLIASFRNIYRILDPLFQTLIDQEYLASHDEGSSTSDSSSTGSSTSRRRSLRSGSITANANSSSSSYRSSPYDFERCKYVLSVWNAMLQVAPRNFIQRTMELKLTDDIQSHFKKFIGKNFYYQSLDQLKTQMPYPSSAFILDVKDYFTLIVSTCVQFMECGVTLPDIKPEDTGNSTPKLSTAVINEKTTLEESIRTKSIMFLRDILVNGKIFKRTTDFACALVECVLSHLRYAVESMDSVFQVELLGILHTLLSHLHSCSASTVPLDSAASPVVILVHSPNFLPTLSQGVLVANDAQVNSSYYSYSLLNYWVDYISSFLPFLETALPFVITTLVPHFCNIIRDNATHGIDSLRSQAIQKLLEGLKKMLSYCVLEYKNPTLDTDNSVNNNEDYIEQSSSVISTAATSVVMPFRLVADLVKDVFTSEETIVKAKAFSPHTEAQQFMLSELPNVIETMSIVWKALRSPYTNQNKITSHRKQQTNTTSHSSGSGTGGSLGLVQYGSLHTKYTIEQGIVHFIDPLIENFKFQLASSLVLLWGNLHPEVEYCIESQPHDLDPHIIDILNNVDSATPETVMSSLVDVIMSVRQNRNKNAATASTSPHDHIHTESDNQQRTISNHIISYNDLLGKSAKLREHVALSFLHVYLRKCILTNKANEILQKLLKLIRDYLFLPNGSAIPVQSLDLLVISMLLKTLYSFLVRWNMQQNDDKKLKTRLIETIHKLIDSGLQCCVRELNNRKAIFTKATKNAKGVAEREHLIRQELHDRHDPSIQFLYLLSSFNSADGDTGLLEELMNKVPHDYTTTSNLIASMLPHLMVILKNNTLINSPRLFHTVLLLSKFNASMLNMRTMRKEIWDLFNLPAFFKVPWSTIQSWKVVFHILINGGETIENSQVTTDEEVLLFEQQQYIQRENKALFNDLLNRFSGTQSIFTSKDSEALQRANLLKRLAFVLYTSETDDYHSFLPAILEKMIDSLKLNSSPASNNILVTNTLFCLRVLITRISPSNLAPFWPMVTTELIKIFINMENNTGNMANGETLVVLEALKFIDFATVILPQEYQMYKWLFIKQLKENQNSKEAYGIFVPYINRLLEEEEEDQRSHNNINNLLSDESNKRRPIDTEVLTSDWQDLQKYAHQLCTERREEQLYYGVMRKHGFDHKYINHLFALDFQELSPEDLMRIQSSAFDPKSIEKHEASWIMISVKDKTNEEEQKSQSDDVHNNGGSENNNTTTDNTAIN
jgi:hypothetical protein